MQIVKHIQLFKVTPIEWMHASLRNDLKTISRNASYKQMLRKRVQYNTKQGPKIQQTYINVIKITNTFGVISAS